MRHVNGLELNDISVYFRENDAHSAFYIDDSKGTLKSVWIDGKRLEDNKTGLVQTSSNQVEEID